MAFGNVFAGLMLLWPLLAVLSTQGFAPLVGLTGIAALFLARPKMPPAAYALVFLLFVAWAAASETWSPYARPLVTGNLLEGNFAVGARSLIVVLTALFAVLTLAAATRTNLTPRARMLLFAAFGLHGLLAITVSLFAGPIIAAIYGTAPQEAVQGVQNINRTINSFGLVLPLIAATLALRFGLFGMMAAAAITALMTSAAVQADSDAALLSVAGMVAGFGLVALLPQNAYRVLFGLTSGYILTAPLLMTGLIRGLSGVEASLPDSFRSRLWSWEAVIDRIWEAPVIGHGLSATRTWREAYAAHPEKLADLDPIWTNYPVIPGHPHNMPLHIWVETGFVGALLVASALILLAIRLPPPSRLRADMRFAVAGVAAASISLFSFAYSVWNEAFWAGLALIAASLILLIRSPREKAPDAG